MNFGKVNIFTGHFGSGKTETAVNFSVMLLKKGYKTALADMDIVNPYFRSADVKEKMTGMGMKVIVPIFANTNTDVPALTGEINIVFEDKELYSVLDVGGDDLGAKVISTYKKKIIKTDYRHFFTVNVKRPATSDSDKIIKYVREIENASGLKVTGLVNNTNLMNLTLPDDIIEGKKIIERAADALNIPVSFHCVMCESVSNCTFSDEAVMDYDSECKKYLRFLSDKDNVLLMKKYIGNLRGVQR